MEIEYGATVVDSEGKVLGIIDYVIRDTWSGEFRKFIVRAKPPASDFAFSPEDVVEADGHEVKLKIRPA
ncbi:MAG: hypothetical protein PHQ43_06055 [Dehalococcoidales bacterium]|nr:hypothetical protein [Dehalococcoidales bacterium]